MTEVTYEERVAQQIDQYAQTINMHDLPQSFHVWSYNYIRPAMQAVYGIESVNDFYVDAFIDASRSIGEKKRILSIGSGDGDAEIELAQTLVARGITDFEILATDLSPVQLGRCRVKAAQAGLESHFNITECDLNNIANTLSVRGPFDLVMANHSLHHIVELEHLFDFILAALKDTGVFATSDMIGRNGHMRWPETAAIVRSFWPLLSPVQRYHAQLKRLETEFLDHDCSTESFEGIRSQDILKLIIDRFHVRKFVGVGGFIEVFTDRAFGHGFNPDDEHDLALITCIADLNDILLDAGVIKPTIMLAHFGKTECSEKYYRLRSAQSCIRKDYPAWVRYNDHKMMT